MFDQPKRSSAPIFDEEPIATTPLLRSAGAPTFGAVITVLSTHGAAASFTVMLLVEPTVLTQTNRNAALT